ncbi:hypothetical protein [Absidia glauca]|uniref:Uncharacterized protein n=1 Tax=Absidia glauca TaxID=4829 RepID=A0A163K945_ABSGL|nr:hypothetical protein [Absidia glauca]
MITISSWAVTLKSTSGSTYGQVHPSHHRSKSSGRSLPLPTVTTLTFWTGLAKSSSQSGPTIGTAITTTSFGTRKRRLPLSIV